MNNPLEAAQKPRWDRQQPQSEDAEKGMLGSMMLRPSLIDDFADYPPESFCHPARRTIFEVLREMSALNMPVDLITITQRLADKNLLEEVGGAPNVTELFMFVPTWTNAKYYATIVREKWVRRRLLVMSAKIAGAAYEEAENIEDLVAQCEEAALKLRGETDAKQQDAVQHCKPAALAALDHIELVYSKRGGVVGLSTGFADIDRMTSGLMGPRMYVIGGLPGSGKTAMALQIAEHVGLDQNSEVLIFSQEMSSMELMVRTLCRRSSIDLQRVRDGFLGRNDIPNLIREANNLSESKIFMDETPGLTTAQFRSRCRAAKLQKNIKLIVLDYLQLMHGVSKSARENRQQEISEISGTIKAVAKELNLPIIVLAQLKRDAEDRRGAPKLSDLRESGAIAQDADFVGLLHVLDKDKKQGSDEAEERDHNTILNVVKQRQGPIGEIKLMFTKKYTLFESVTQELYSNNAEKRQQ